MSIPPASSCVATRVMLHGHATVASPLGILSQVLINLFGLYMVAYLHGSQIVKETQIERAHTNQSSGNPDRARTTTTSEYTELKKPRVQGREEGKEQKANVLPSRRRQSGGRMGGGRRAVAVEAALRHRLRLASRRTDPVAFAFASRR